MSQRVSVVLPVRNGAAYLDEALDSILTQSAPPAEVIVVDDGSTDETPERLSSYAQDIQVIRQAPLGLGAALNRGLGATTGALLAFCDADDVWTPARLEHQVAYLDRHDGCAGVGGLVQQFMSPGRSDLYRRVRVDWRPTAGCLLGALVIRRGAADRIGTFDKTMHTAASIDWVARGRHLGLELATLDEVVLRRRIHGENMTMADAEQTRAGLFWAVRAQRRRHQTPPRP